MKMSIARRTVFRTVASSQGVRANTIAATLDMSIFTVRSALSWLRHRKLIGFGDQSLKSPRHIWKPTARGKLCFEDNSFLRKEFS